MLAVVVVAVASGFVVAVAFPLPKVEIALEAVTVVTAASEKSFWQINRERDARSSSSERLKTSIQ